MLNSSSFKTKSPQKQQPLWLSSLMHTHLSYTGKNYPEHFLFNMEALLWRVQWLQMKRKGGGWVLNLDLDGLRSSGLTAAPKNCACKHSGKSLLTTILLSCCDCAGLHSSQSCGWVPGQEGKQATKPSTEALNNPLPKEVQQCWAVTFQATLVTIDSSILTWWVFQMCREDQIIFQLFNI